MELLLIFGVYIIRVVASEEIIERCLRFAEPFRVNGTESENVTITIREDKCCDIGYTSDEWQIASEGDVTRVVHSTSGKRVFSMAYNKCRKNIAVTLYRGDSACLKVAFQYAMMIALSGSCIGLHAVTMLCGDKVVLLSAPSGTGKTTLARLLQKSCEAVVINGDFALLSIADDGRTYYEPTPFCGSSGQTVNVRLPIDRIVFLRQGRNNCYTKPAGRCALRWLMSNVFIPSWDGHASDSIVSTIAQIPQNVTIGVFAFEPTAIAANMLFSIIK